MPISPLESSLSSNPLDLDNLDLSPNLPDAIPAIEHDLSEQQLRELYDKEEIERFLNLFSAYVTEVQLPELPLGGKNPNQRHQSTSTVLTTYDNEGLERNTVNYNSSRNNISSTPGSSIAEDIAFRYIMPMLPAAQPPPPSFTLGRLRLSIQRLYLAVQPVYIPFLNRMAKLATWKDKKTSFMYCAIFWVMWYHDLFLPCLLFRIFYSLVRRKVFPYPTLEELREHRCEITRANKFGDQISAKLSTSSFGVRELWRIFKVFNKSIKTKAKNSTKDKVREKGFPVSPELNSFPESEELDDTEDNQDVKELGRLGIHIINELADLHERIKNIFIWRRPVSSCIYGTAIFFIFLITLLLPAKYIAKLLYSLGGILFWHVTPVIAALPSPERARIPPAFSDVPTDADYAMELIAQRVAAGLDIKPSKQTSIRRHTVGPDGRYLIQVDEQQRQSESKGKSVDWKKWGERAAIGKTWVDDGKRFVSGRQDSATWPPRNPLVPHIPVAIAIPEQPVESYTFPVQHASGPGLITITPTTLLFTPLMSLNPKFIILLSNVRGVKKIGMLKGLYIRSVENLENGEQVEREDKFIWVGARDELFARLIGPDGKRWLKV